MDAPLEDLGLNLGVPFPETANIPELMGLNIALRKTNIHRPVMDPVLTNVFGVPERSEVEGTIMLENFDVFNGVNAAAFGPPTENPASEGNQDFQFRIYDRELATCLPKRRLILKPPRGPSIVVVPRCKPRRAVTRACAELTISEWMRHQSGLPANERINVPFQHISYLVDGQVKEVAVWMYRGLEPVMGEPDTFKILF